MGRHARGAVHPRLTVRAVAIAVPAALIVASAAWWAGSVGTASPTDSTVTGSAVVVSSLACQNGDEGTVVDVLEPAGQPPGTTRRATLDSCGHRPGETLDVEYSTADPGRVALSGTMADDDDPAGRLLPLGLLLAALLGVAAVVAVVRDARRPHQAGGDDAPAGAAGHGRHARSDEDEPATPALPVEEATAPSDLDLLFPPPENLRDSLHDELFTHRSTAGV